MLALLPFLALALLVPICRRSADTWRAAGLVASVLWGIALTLMTEGLSLFRQVTAPSLIGLWGVACLGLAALNLVGGRRLWEQAPVGWQNLTPFLKLLLLCVGVIAITCGTIAFIAPPNNWDSMAYHMTRVEHWIQNRSVAHYPTHVLRELHRNPWAEFCILHCKT